jgi:hypothetical protein
MVLDLASDLFESTFLIFDPATANVNDRDAAFLAQDHRGNAGDRSYRVGHESRVTKVGRQGRSGFLGAQLWAMRVEKWRGVRLVRSAFPVP